MTPASPGQVDCTAAAKINLYLRVVGRRADGYHLLDSLFAFAGLGDRLSIRPGEALTLATDGPFAHRLPPPEENLVLRAARSLAAAAGVPPRAEIRLTKDLPIAAGLGSGSADAAAVLTALSVFWGIPEGAVDLMALGLELGADVPACLFGRTCFVGGIGEVVDPAPALPAAGLLLVNPGVELATASVFAARRGGFSPPERFDESPRDAAALAALLAERENDLAAAAIRFCPVIGDVLAALEAAPGCRLARMSGSGSTCFGLFDDAASAAAAVGAVAREGWWVAASSIVPAASAR